MQLICEDFYPCCSYPVIVYSQDFPFSKVHTTLLYISYFVVLLHTLGAAFVALLMLIAQLVIILCMYTKGTEL